MTVVYTSYDYVYFDSFELSNDLNLFLKIEKSFLLYMCDLDTKINLSFIDNTGENHGFQ